MDHTSNYSSQHSIRLNKTPKRLYMISGKGGVGKTTLGLALTRYLNDNGKKAFYVNLSNETELDRKKLKNNHMPFFPMDLLASTTEYIGKKLKSETIAHWVMKTPFFKSLFAVVPGLGHVILLGHIIDYLQENEDITFVVDSPATGHMISMLESPINFKDIFKSGIIVEDIKRMLNFLNDTNNFKILISTLPTQLSTKEALELETQLSSLGYSQITKLLNCSFVNLDDKELPDFLQAKVETEKKLINEEFHPINYSTQLGPIERIVQISYQMGAIV